MKISHRPGFIVLQAAATLLLAASSTCASAQQSDAATDVGTGSVRPAKIDIATCSRPTYPAESLRKEETGDVSIQFTLSPEGTVVGSEILKSSGFRLLDQAAVDALSKCRFSPATKDRQPVEGKTDITYSWRLDPPPRRNALAPNQYLRQDAHTGSNIRRPAVTSPLPMDKRWQDLTEEQQAYVKSFYEKMTSGDEPPYPAEGLGALYQAIVTAQQHLQVEGRLSLEVLVDSQGQATSVDILSAPNKEMGNAAGRIAMLTRYKPAVCGGQACTMSFPIRINMALRK